MDKVAVIGAGSMGAALGRALTRTSALKASQIHFSAPTMTHLHPLEQEGFATIHDNIKAVADADVVVLAVKPPLIELVCLEICPALSSDAIVISSAAAVTLESLQKWMPQKLIVRVMANLAIAEGQGRCAFALGKPNELVQAQLTRLFSGSGSCYWMQEPQIAAFTMLVGSAPAYHYALANELSRLALEHGFNQAQADDFARASLLAAASGATVAADSSFDELIAEIMTPKGTTEAALTAMASAGLPEVVATGIESGICRIDEMASALSGEH